MISPPTVFGDSAMSCTAEAHGLFSRFDLTINIERCGRTALLQRTEALTHRVARWFPAVVDAVVQVVLPVVRNLDLFTLEVGIQIQRAVDDRFGHGVVGVPDITEVQVLTPRTAAFARQPGY